jgi:hypothetical protein
MTGETPRDLGAAMEAVLGRVRADAAGVGLEVRLRVDPGAAWGFDRDHVVATIDGHEFGARGRPLCAVGHLVASCRARGWRVR